MRHAAILATAALCLGVAGGPGRAQQAADWTVMVYLNGDTVAAGGEDLSISDFNELEAVGSSSRVHVVAQWDRAEGDDALTGQYPTDTTQSWTTARRYLVTADPAQRNLDPDALVATDAGFRIASTVLLDLGEVDSGAEDTLVDFAAWTMERFPAQHYLLILAGEGGSTGWNPRSHRGLMFDNSPTTGSFLSSAELRAAMARIKTLNSGTNLDVLALDVDKHAIIEEAYEVRASCDYVAGRFLSKEGDGFPYELWLSRFVGTPPTDTTTIESTLNTLAGDYIGSYTAGTNVLGGASSTGFAVYRTNRLEAMATGLDTLADALLADLPGNAAGILRALASVQRDDGPNAGEGDNIDVQHFAALLGQEVTDPAVTTAAAAIPTLLTDCRVNSSTRGTLVGDLNVDNFNGLGAYFPAESTSFDSNYSVVTQFVEATSWDELVQGVLTLFSDQNGPDIQISSPSVGATIIENPPQLVATIVDREQGGRVNAGTIEVRLDGVLVDADEVEFDQASGLLTHRVPAPLSVTSHTFSISARDLSGNLSTASSNFRISVANLQPGLQTFSLPRVLTENQADPGLVFGNNNFLLARWVPNLFGTNKYRYHPDSFASFLPPDAGGGAAPTVASPPAGLAYWLRIREARPLSALPGTNLTASEYKIRLYADPDGQPGWNMLGCPYDVSAVSLASLFVELGNGSRITFRKAIEQRLTPGVLFTYVPNTANVNATGRYDFAEAGEGQLLRLKGHWLRANQDMTLVVSSGGRAVSRAPREFGGWQFELVAEAGELSDATRLGVSPEATRGYDPAADIAAPPALPGGLELRVTHADWGLDSGRYVRDLRGPGGDEVWDLELRGPAGPVTLRWPNLRAVPGDVDLIVADAQTGRRQRMRTSTALTIDHDGSPRALRVSAVPRGTGGLSVAGITLSRGRGAGFDVGYVLSASAEVRVTIRSLAGRALRSLPTTMAEPGRSVSYWDGRLADGKPVPNGIYQLELVAVGGDGELARQIVTVKVAR